MGGWNSTSTWFCNSGLGPLQQRLKSGVPAARKASVGPSARKKKKAVTTNITTSAHATIGSFMRCR